MARDTRSQLTRSPVAFPNKKLAHNRITIATDRSLLVQGADSCKLLLLSYNSAVPLCYIVGDNLFSRVASALMKGESAGRQLSNCLAEAKHRVVDGLTSLLIS